MPDSGYIFSFPILLSNSLPLLGTGSCDELLDELAEMELAEIPPEGMSGNSVFKQLLDSPA